MKEEEKEQRVEWRQGNYVLKARESGRQYGGVRHGKYVNGESKVNKVIKPSTKKVQQVKYVLY